MDYVRPDAMQGSVSVGLGIDQAYNVADTDADGEQPSHPERSLNDSAPVGSLRSRSSGPRRHQRTKRVACKECRQAKVGPQR